MEGLAMRTIEIEQDIHDYLLQRVQSFGESASDVLRRELGLDGTTNEEKISTAAIHELEEILSSSEVRMARGVVGKFLNILGAVAEQKGEEFSLILAIQGRGRVYFARSQKEIEQSGNSTQPKQIPGTTYWAMTNSPTSQKQSILKEVLEGLGYSSKAVKAAVSAIAA